MSFFVSQKSNRPKVVALDMDDTLVGYDERGLPYPIPGTANATHKLREMGFYIVIYTCRTTVAIQEGRLPQELAYIRDLLNSFSIEYDEIYAGEKLIADFYVDDRNIQFNGDWDKVCRTLSGLNSAFKS